MTPALPASPDIYLLFQDLIEQRTGLTFDSNNLETMISKIEPLVHARGYDSFLDYFYLLKYGDTNEQEWDNLQSALAVNESFFLREYDQIEAVANHLSPQLLRLHPDRPVRIWHAGCSSGEEPVSMTIALLTSGHFLSGGFEIVATDFNHKALAQARSGLYRSRSFRSVPPEYLERYFLPAPGGLHKVAEFVRSRIEYRYLNLLDEESMQAMAGFDVIFCRNVFIYFSQPAIERVANQFYQLLSTPGYLFLGASESLLSVPTPFEFEEIGDAFVYRK